MFTIPMLLHWYEKDIAAMFNVLACLRANMPRFISILYVMCCVFI